MEIAARHRDKNGEIGRKHGNTHFAEPTDQASRPAVPMTRS
jgi:hypothetical protein